MSRKIFAEWRYLSFKWAVCQHIIENTGREYRDNGRTTPAIYILKGGGVQVDEATCVLRHRLAGFSIFVISEFHHPPSKNSVLLCLWVPWSSVFWSNVEVLYLCWNILGIFCATLQSYSTTSPRTMLFFLLISHAVCMSHILRWQPFNWQLIWASRSFHACPRADNRQWVIV